ncbi:hypothetical protein CEV31_4259 [Brucella thiophenivorans]|uniref:Uncharacterized protein n=2 Tax=Brucella thiophenivorans TaxID=571255 RepID=A0A256FTQ9_9HYPH|nr:hypothetical protein CEV31_4259 [Brucella thiophenivorans]
MSDEARFEAARRSVKEGLERSKATDPDIEKLIEHNKRGYGPEPKQMLKQVKDRYKNEWNGVSPIEKNLMGLGIVHSFYIDDADHKRAIETAKLIEDTYRYANRRFEKINEISSDQVSELEAEFVRNYAGLPNAQALKIMQLDNGNILLNFKNRNGMSEERTLRTPRSIVAQSLGIPESSVETELEMAIEP